MATIKRELSPKLNGSGKSEIIIRISVGRGIQPRIKSGLFVTPARFKDGKFIKPRANQKEAAEIQAVETELTDLEQYLLGLCETTSREQLNREFFEKQVEYKQHPEKCPMREHAEVHFLEVLSDYIDKQPFSDVRKRDYRVLLRSLGRYESYRRLSGAPDYALSIDAFGTDDVYKFEDFLRREHEYSEYYPAIYEAYPITAKLRRNPGRPQPRGNNTICCTFKRLRAFFGWCNRQGLTANMPFANYTGVSAEVYGTPYYITIEERDIIAETDLSARPALEAQRDIFIFQCLIGCRVNDLLRLTRTNIINGAVEYIAGKTKGEHPTVIRVPLHPRASAIVGKYSDCADGRLLPFISAQRYNDAIKHIFTLCGITRPVTILNPTTGQEEQRPINEIASSHIARRTFVGNLYKQVKDPNLVGKLSGHKEGSKAFARYRDIDEDMRRDLISLL